MITFNKQPVLNRHSKKMLVHFELAQEPSEKLVFIQHGYSGSMDEDHIRAFSETFLANGYNVLMMDSTNSFNDADGNLEDNTIQSHYDDLEDTIQWASKQEWYREPFALAGHSLGGLSTLIYAQNNPDKISLLFPAAAVVSGELLEQAFKDNIPDAYNDMKTRGKMMVTCSYKDIESRYRPYSWLEKMHAWNALEKIDNITMPTLLLVGSDDAPTPPEHQKLLFDKITGEKQLHVIENSDHCYAGKIPEACRYLSDFLKAHE